MKLEIDQRKAKLIREMEEAMDQPVGMEIDGVGADDAAASSPSSSSSADADDAAVSSSTPER